MNAEAENEIKRLAKDAGGCFTGMSITDAVTAAMRWAYADAAKVCREYADGLETRFPDPHLSGRIDASNSLSEAIEGRAR